MNQYTESFKLIELERFHVERDIRDFPVPCYPVQKSLTPILGSLASCMQPDPLCE